jgi:hypothetical protein
MSLAHSTRAERSLTITDREALTASQTLEFYQAGALMLSLPIIVLFWLAGAAGIVTVIADRTVASSWIPMTSAILLWSAAGWVVHNRLAKALTAWRVRREQAHVAGFNFEVVGYFACLAAPRQRFRQVRLTLQFAAEAPPREMLEALFANVAATIERHDSQTVVVRGHSFTEIVKEDDTYFDFFQRRKLQREYIDKVIVPLSIVHSIERVSFEDSPVDCG